MFFDDEFRFLPADAARVGAQPPHVDRVAATLADGRQVSGLKFDPDHSPRIVALHGAGLNAHSFDPMLISLSEPALAIDLPGHGRSSWREDADYSPETLAADLAPALAQLAPAPYALVGHSLGALTAAILAARTPSLVSHLILIDITPGVHPTGTAGAVAEFIQGQRSFATRDEIVDRAIAFGIGSDRAALTRGVTLNTRRREDGRLEWTHHFAHLTGLTPAGDGHPFAPLWNLLADLTMPVTLIRARSGMVTAELSTEWSARLPSRRVVSLDGPHNLHEACPAELATAVRGLLTASA